MFSDLNIGKSSVKGATTGDLVSSCLRTCRGNLWETILNCIIQDDVLLGVAVLVAKGAY